MISQMTRTTTAAHGNRVRPPADGGSRFQKPEAAMALLCAALT